MGNNDFKIILQALLDETSLSDIEKKLAKKKINLSLDFDFAKSLNESEKQVKELSKRFKEMFNFKTDSEALSFTKKYLTESNKLIAQNEKLQEKSNAEMQKALEKTEQLRKEEEQRQAKAQNDAINKNLEKEYQEREKLTEAMARGREQSELARQAEEKRQQKVQNNAINKSLTDEYNLREKNRVAAEKQNQIDLERASSFTKANSQKIKDAMSKYSYGYSSDAKALMQELNRGMSNFKIDSNGNISNVSDTIAQYETRIKSVLESLQQTHKTNLSALNSEISEETKLQSQKDAFNQKNLNAIDLEIQKREEASRRFSDSIKAQMAEEQNLLDKVSAINKAVANGQVSKDLNGKSGVSTLYNSLNTETTSTVIPESLKADYQNLITLSEKLNTSMSDTQKVETWKKYQSTLESVKNQISTVSTTTKQLASQTEVSNTIANLNDQLRKNSAYTKSAKTEIKGFITELSKGNVASERLGEITTRAKVLHSEMGSLNKIGFSFGDKLKNGLTKFGDWFGVAAIFTNAVQGAKKVVNNVIEIDTAMTDLRKVCDATDTEFKSFLTTATENAKQLGASISDVVSATADFARLGYNLPDATELSRIAILYKNVGDIDISDATTSIISTMKAFHISADSAERIVDVFNEVGNKFAISFAGIGDALQNSASSLVEANNTLEQATALSVGANDVMQDPNAVGTMWKTVAMRIRGAKTELEEAGEDTEGLVQSTSQLQALIKGMTGFDILESDQKTFKSTYDIIVGIGEKYKELSDIDQASLLEALAGKRQGNALASALNNVEDIKNAYETATNAAGSAAKEQEEYEKSIQYSLDKGKASIESFSEAFLNSGLVKGIVDLGTVGVDGITKLTSALGGLGTVGLGAGLFAGIKNVGRDKRYLVTYAYPC